MLDENRARSLVGPFYRALLSPDATEIERTLAAITTPSWKNCASDQDCDSRADTVQRWLRRAQTIPDAQWHMTEMFFTHDRIVVRGQFTGTPRAPFLGVDGQGRSFAINTADIHEIENGRIARTHHLENLGLAIRQLRGSN